MDTIQYDDFSKLDLRVATIRQAELHPNADKLLKLQVDAGDTDEAGQGTSRQICAGIRGHYSPDALIGKQIVIVANLAPRTIRGEVSNGMLLAASAIGDAGDERSVVLVTPMADVPAGSSVG